MDIPATVSLRRNVPLRDFVIFGGAACVGLVADMVVAAWHPRHSFRLLTTYALPLVAAAGLVLLYRVSRRSTPRLSRKAAWLGAAFVSGAAVTDLLSTVLVNPDLSLEANPYVRILLDRGHSLRFVYWHTAVMQILSVTLLCGIWTTFLRHVPVLLGSIAESRPASRLEFLKAATGGSHLTLRQWLVPIRLSELPTTYHCLWPLLVSIIFGVSLLRWYVALEWMDLVEPTLVWRCVVLFSGLTVTLALYFVGLSLAYRRHAASL